MALGGLKTVPVMEVRGKEQGRERAGGGQGPEPRGQRPRGRPEPRPLLPPARSFLPSLGDHSTHTGFREAEGVPEGTPHGSGDCCVQEAEPQREAGGAGGPCSDPTFPEFLGPRPPVCGQAWLVPKPQGRREAKQGQTLNLPVIPGQRGLGSWGRGLGDVGGALGAGGGAWVMWVGPWELGEGPGRCGRGLGSWGRETRAVVASGQGCESPNPGEARPCLTKRHPGFPGRLQGCLSRPLGVNRNPLQPAGPWGCCCPSTWVP